MYNRRSRVHLVGKYLKLWCSKMQRVVLSLSRIQNTLSWLALNFNPILEMTENIKYERSIPHWFTVLAIGNFGVEG